MKLLAFCLGLLAAARAHDEEFREHLHLRHLDDGRVSALFSFTTFLKDTTPRSPQSIGEDDIRQSFMLYRVPRSLKVPRPVAQHYTLFPLALGQVLREHAVTEVHLTLNAGKWDYTRWGYPEDPAVATGAELWAWMGDSSNIRYVVMIFETVYKPSLFIMYE